MNDVEPEATPTFEELRSSYALGMCRTAYYDPDRPAEYQRHLDEFDRCMAGHDAEVKVMFARPAAVPVDPEIVCGVLETMRRETVRVSVPASRRSAVEATANRILTEAQGRVRDALASMPRPDVNERDALERALDEAAQRWEHGTVHPDATLGEVLADAALAWFRSLPSSAWFAGRVEPALWDLLRRDGHINVADWSTCVETAGRHPGSPIALLVTAHRRNVTALLETLGVPPTGGDVSSPRPPSASLAPRCPACGGDTSEDSTDTQRAAGFLHWTCRSCGHGWEDDGTTPADPDQGPWVHDGHRPVQHRDSKPPWCNACGWSSPTPEAPARKWSILPPRRRTDG